MKKSVINNSYFSEIINFDFGSLLPQNVSYSSKSSTSQNSSYLSFDFGFSLTNSYSFSFPAFQSSSLWEVINVDYGHFSPKNNSYFGSIGGGFSWGFDNYSNDYSNVFPVEPSLPSDDEPSVPVDDEPLVLGSVSDTIQTNQGASASISSGQATKDNTLQLTGTVIQGVEVSVYDGLTFLGKATVTGETWTFNTPVLADGLHDLTVIMTSRTKEQSFVVSATIDTVVNASFDTTIQTNTGSTKTIQTGGITQDDTLGFSGKAEAGSEVKVYQGNTYLGVTRADASGSWQFTTPQLADGQYNFSAQVTDQVGNTKTITGISAQVKKPVAPSVNLGSVSNTIGTNQGATTSINSGQATKDNTLRLTGTVVNSTVKVAIYDGNLFLGNATVIGGKTWRFDTKALKDGLHNFKVVLTSGTKTQSLALSATIDTVVNAQFNSTIQTDTGSTPSIQTGGVTQDDTLGLSGQAEAGSVLKLYQRSSTNNISVLLGQVTADASGVWQFTTSALAEAKYEFSAVVTDRVGNTKTITGLSAEIKKPVVAPEPAPAPSEPVPPSTPQEWSSVWGWGKINVADALEIQKKKQSSSSTNQSTNTAVQGNGKTAIQSSSSTGIQSKSSTPVYHCGLKLPSTQGVVIQNNANASLGQEFFNFKNIWDQGVTGKGATVAIIDTGIDTNNATLMKNVNWTYSYNFVSNNSNFADDHGHGTAVATVVTEMAPDTTLMVLKALDAKGSGSADSICKAIYHAVDKGAQIINMSLGGGDYYGFADALKYAQEHNVLVVMAAGNDGGSSPLSPASYAKQFNNCIAVGASTGNSLASFSNQAGSKEAYSYVCAPGVNINVYNKDGGRSLASGTSFASPFVAGAAALLLSQSLATKGDTSASNIAASISQSARPLDGVLAV